MTVNALNFRKDYFTNQNRLKVTLWGCHAPPLDFLVLAAFWVGVGGWGVGGPWLPGVRLVRDLQLVFLVPELGMLGVVVDHRHE